MSKKTQYAVQLACTQLTQMYKVEQLAFATFTVAKYRDGVENDAFFNPRLAQKNWNSFNTHFLKNLVENGVVVIEGRPEKSKNAGSVHWHCLLVFPFSLKVKKNLLWLKNFVGKNIENYGIGKVFDIQPVRDVRAVSCYIAKYIAKMEDVYSKDSSIQQAWKGIRRSRYLGRSTKVRKLYTPTGYVTVNPVTFYTFRYTYKRELTSYNYLKKRWNERKNRISLSWHCTSKFSKLYYYRYTVSWRNSSSNFGWIQSKNFRNAMKATGLSYEFVSKQFVKWGYVAGICFKYAEKSKKDAVQVLTSVFTEGEYSTVQYMRTFL